MTYRGLSAAERAQIDASLAEVEKLRRDPTSDYWRGAQTERDYLRSRELDLLRVRNGEMSPDELPTVSPRDVELRGFEIYRREHSREWSSGSPEAEAMRARERDLLESGE